MTLKIERNIPMPERGFGPGRKMSEEGQTALKMKPGDSVFCATERSYQRVTNALRSRKLAYRQRKVTGGYRIWRVDGRTLPKAANA